MVFDRVFEWFVLHHLMLSWISLGIALGLLSMVLYIRFWHPARLLAYCSGVAVRLEDSAELKILHVSHDMRPFFTRGQYLNDLLPNLSIDDFQRGNGHKRFCVIHGSKQPIPAVFSSQAIKSIRNFWLVRFEDLSWLYSKINEAWGPLVVTQNDGKVVGGAVGDSAGFFPGRLKGQEQSDADWNITDKQAGEDWTPYFADRNLDKFWLCTPAALDQTPLVSWIAFPMHDLQAIMDAVPFPVKAQFPEYCLPNKWVQSVSHADTDKSTPFVTNIDWHKFSGAPPMEFGRVTVEDRLSAQARKMEKMMTVLRQKFPNPQAYLKRLFEAAALLEPLYMKLTLNDAEIGVMGEQRPIDQSHEAVAGVRPKIHNQDFKFNNEVKLHVQTDYVLSRPALLFLEMCVNTVYPGVKAQAQLYQQTNSRDNRIKELESLRLERTKLQEEMAAHIKCSTLFFRELNSKVFLIANQVNDLYNNLSLRSVEKIITLLDEAKQFSLMSLCFEADPSRSFSDPACINDELWNFWHNHHVQMGQFGIRMDFKYPASQEPKMNAQTHMPSLSLAIYIMMHKFLKQGKEDTLVVDARMGSIAIESQKGHRIGEAVDLDSLDVVFVERVFKHSGLSFKIGDTGVSIER